MRSLTLFLLVAGCAHNAETKKEDKPVAASSAVQKDAVAPASSPLDKACTADLECGDKQLCVRNHCVDISASLAECTQVRVHFPFNSAEIDPNELASLQRSARCLKGDTGMHVTIEGNADERGTEEYNMALGDQRAIGVARYIQSFGASQSQLKTVSYGKENPLCTEHDEDCWAKNRRAEVKKP